MLQDYMSPEEAADASAGSTDRALGAVIAMLYALYMERRNCRVELDATDDEDLICYFENQLKLIGKEETSLQRIMSGLQSRLAVARHA
jgi:hypothetical protein